MCMIVSCLLAIIAIVVLAMTGNDNGKFTGVPKDTITEETGWEQTNKDDGKTNRMLLAKLVENFLN